MLHPQPEPAALPRYNPNQSYLENYNAAPNPVSVEVPAISGSWNFCGMRTESPLGVPAGPLLNGKWCLYYASLGFDVLTYKTVRSTPRDCYPVPNLVPVECDDLNGDETRVPVNESMSGSWAVSFGMPSKAPDIWRADIEKTRETLPPEKILSVSVVGTVQDGWTLQDLANDYAKCARWAKESGADAVEVNFSCPNVSTVDGQLCQSPPNAAQVAATVRRAIGKTPLIVKIGHVDPRLIAALVESLGSTVNAVAMTNSVAAMVIDQNGETLFNGQRRGICGNGCRQVSLLQTRLFRQAIAEAGIDLEIIGVGGAFTAEHVQQYLDAGASAIHIATAAMLDPLVAIKIKSELIRGSASSDS